MKKGESILEQFGLSLSEKDQNRILELAEEMGELLKENLLKPPDEISDSVERFQEIRDELKEFGVHVEWTAELNPEDPGTLEVKIHLFVPKDSLPAPPPETEFN